MTETRETTPEPTSTPPASCHGDCNGDRRVDIGELITAVNIALDRASLDTCRAVDSDGNQMVAINELIAAVRSALGGLSRRHRLSFSRVGRPWPTASPYRPSLALGE